MSSRLGEVLIQKGILTPDRLKHALDNQLIYGGHLGTCLVELGFLDVDQLAKVLGEQFQIDHAEREWLENIRPEVLSTLPPKLVQRHKAIPFAIAGRALRVAMIDPTDLLALDELSFAAGYKIEPWVAPELVVLRAMERHYELQRKLRHIPVSSAGDTTRPSPAPQPPASPPAPSESEPSAESETTTPPAESHAGHVDRVRAELLRVVEEREAVEAAATEQMVQDQVAASEAGEYIPQTIPRAAELAHHGKGELRVDWIKQKKKGREIWCDLFTTPFEHRHFNDLRGVFVIWYHGRNPVLCVGHGMIREKLTQAREDPSLQEIAREQTVYVSWAKVPPGSEENVERYLIESLTPQLSVHMPTVSPLAINLPR